MQEKMNWDDSKYEIFDIVEVLENNNKIQIPLKCPICEHDAAHVYMYRWEDNRGTVWVWCSSCKACTHASRYTLPSWWENDEFMMTSELASHPIFLDEKFDLVDNHLRGLLKKRK